MNAGNKTIKKYIYDINHLGGFRDILSFNGKSPMTG